MTNHTLIGQFDSPFVRRVAITMHYYDIPYEHHNWSVFADRDEVIELNPLCRVPVLQIDSDETLIESASILDYLDELVGPERALMPASGPARRQELKRTSVALAAAEKAVAMIYERHKRAAGTQDPNWSRRLRDQVISAVQWLGQEIAPFSTPLAQSQLTTAVLMRFLREYLPDVQGSINAPGLLELEQQCERQAEFRAVPFPKGDQVTAATENQ
jgi:glutathione S-transferase